MRLPAPLLRRNPHVHKNNFGHVLVLAGSSTKLGAAALCALAAMRSGCGLVTLGIPRGLNLTVQKKISPVIMTLPLAETKTQALAFAALQQLNRVWSKFQSAALGPGLGMDESTQRLVKAVVMRCPVPLVVDADGCNALVGYGQVIKQAAAPRILTPHPGEMARLTGLTKNTIESNRLQVAKDFAKRTRCIIVLKGHRSIIASFDGKYCVNRTGNAGMATAGSGDVLTGMIAAFLAQGMEAYDAARWGAYFHGKAGDRAARGISRASLIATDILVQIPYILSK